MTENQVTEAAEPVPFAWMNGYEVQLRDCYLVIEGGPDEGKNIGPPRRANHDRP
jgi:hypothetical protein